MSDLIVPNQPANFYNAITAVDTSDLNHWPKPECVEGKDRHGGRSYANVFPYNSDNWKQTVVRLNLKMPFTAKNIISLDMGKSVCANCKVVFAGAISSVNCDRMVRKVQDPRYAYSWIISEAPVKTLNAVRIERCGGSVIWSLQKEFNYQQDVFRFIDELSSIQNDGLDQHIDMVPQHMREEYRAKLIAKRLVDLESRTINAFNQIAHKMNSAGHCLQW